MTSPVTARYPVTPEHQTDEGTIMEKLAKKFLPNNVNTKLEIFEELGIYSLDAFTYVDEGMLKSGCILGTEENVKFKPMEIATIMSLQNWILSLDNPKDWETKDKDDFNNWRKQQKLQLENKSVEPEKVEVTKKKSSFTSVKKQLSDFNDMNKDLYFSSWYESFESTASLHEIEELLDPLYVP
jgi:hypothetical protein